MKENNTTMNLRTKLFATGLFLTTPIVAAQDENAFSSIVDIIQDLAIGIGQIVTLGGIENSTPVLQAIYFLMIFTAFFIGGLIAFGGRSNMDAKQARKYSAIFAALIALTATIVTPTAFVTTLSGTLSLIIMSLMFLAIIALPLFVMYKLVPDVSGKNDMFVGMTKVILSIVSILVISIYADLIEGMDEQAATSVASEGIGGALAQPIVEIISTLTGIVLLIFLGTLIHGVKQAWPKSKNNPSNSGNEWYKMLGPSDKNLLNNEIENTVKDLDDIRRGQSPVRERIQDYLKDAKKELHKPTGGSLSKVLGYLKNMLEDIDGDGRDKTLKDELQEQRSTWEKHKENLKNYNDELRSLPEKLTKILHNLKEGQVNTPENVEELTTGYYKNKDYVDDFGLDEEKNKFVKQVLEKHKDLIGKPTSLEGAEEVLEKRKKDLRTKYFSSLKLIDPKDVQQLTSEYYKDKNRFDSNSLLDNLLDTDTQQEEFRNYMENHEELIGSPLPVKEAEEYLDNLTIKQQLEQVFDIINSTSIPAPSNFSVLTQKFIDNENDLKNYFNKFDLTNTQKSEAIKTANIYLNEFDEPKTFQNIQEEIDKLEAVVKSQRIEKDFDKLEKDLSELENDLMQKVGDLGDQMRKQAAKENPPKSRKEAHNMLQRIDNKVSAFRNDFESLRKDVTNIENVLDEA